MKLAAIFVVALALATPARAQHVHEQAPPAAPQRGGGPQTPPIEVPWNDAIPAGTADHAARAGHNALATYLRSLAAREQIKRKGMNQ